MFEKRVSHFRIFRADRLKRAATEVAAGFVVHRPVAFGRVLHGCADPGVGVAQPLVLHAGSAGDLVAREVGVADTDLDRVDDDAANRFIEDNAASGVIQRHLVVGRELRPVLSVDLALGGFAVGDPELVVDFDNAIKVAAENEFTAVGVDKVQTEFKREFDRWLTGGLEYLRLGIVELEVFEVPDDRPEQGVARLRRLASEQRVVWNELALGIAGAVVHAKAHGFDRGLHVVQTSGAMNVVFFQRFVVRDTELKVHGEAWRLPAVEDGKLELARTFLEQAKHGRVPCDGHLGECNGEQVLGRRCRVALLVLSGHCGPSRRRGALR